MTMIVELKTDNSKKKQKELAEKIKIVYLISLFGDMKYQDIMDYFPEYDIGHISKILNELVTTQQLYYDKPYYTTYALNQNSLGKQLRQKYLDLTFIRFNFTLYWITILVKRRFTASCTVKQTIFLFSNKY